MLYTQPIWLIPFGSVAHRAAVGIPDASLQFPGFASHGRRYSPITTSSTRVPSARGSDHFQQNPAATRAVKPSSAHWRTAASSSSGESNTRKSNPSVPSQITLAVRRIPSVLSIQFTKPSDPAQRNCTSSSYSDTSASSAPAYL